jgi:phenylacetate-CoA ligase
MVAWIPHLRKAHTVTTASPPTPRPEPASDAVLRELHREDQRQLSGRYVQRLHWSRTRIADERRLRLSKLLAVAQESSPWHRQRLTRVDAGRLREDELRRLPVMNKQDVMASFDQIVTDPRLTLARVEAHLAGLDGAPRYLLDRYQPVVSGGSSGVRGVFVYDWRGWTSCYAGAFRYFVRDLGGQAVSMAVIAAGSAAHISRAILHTFSDPATIRIHAVPITLPIERIIAELRELQPDVLFTYPSGLADLTEAARAGELRIAPRAIITGGEPLTPELREAAESQFGARVLNWWVSSEGGPMGIGCGRGPWMHLSDDLIIVEPVDDEGEPVEPGSRASKVLLTVLYNHALPLIRYELTDEVTVIDEACPCGSVHTLIADVQGRRDDGFSYSGVSIHPHVFRTILDRAPDIVEYRVLQTADGARVEIRGPADREQLRRELTEALGAQGLEAPRVSVLATTDFEREATGKVKRFVPLAG